MANAQAYGGATAFASATYYASAPGIYATSYGSLGTYGFSASVGTNWSGYDNYSYSFYGSTQGVETYGYSQSFPQVGGAGFYSLLQGATYATFTNESSSDVTLFVQALTEGIAQSQATGWNDQALAEGAAEVYDSNNILWQESVAEAATGSNYGGDFWAEANYYTYGSAYGSSYQSGFDGHQYPFTEYAGYGLESTYAITLAPGQSDTVYVVTGEEHVAYSTTPGPEAIVPFALGLIGALRRRKKA